MSLPEKLEQVAILRFAPGSRHQLGGQPLLTVRELIDEIFEGLKGKSPQSGAVSSNLPLLRTLQLAADAAAKGSLTENRLVPVVEISN